MKLYLVNNFCERMALFFKRFCLAFAFLLAANPKAIENQNNQLDTFNGDSALDLGQGVTNHPSH